MTTEYQSKEDALKVGLVYAGYDKDLIDETMKNLPEPKKLKIGWPQDKEVDSYTFKGKDGKEFMLGVGKFRDGFDLWLMDIETGFCQRT